MRKKSKSPSKKKKNDDMLKIHTKNERDMNELSSILNIELISKKAVPRRQPNKFFDEKCIPEFDCETTKNYCTSKIKMTKSLMTKLSKLDLDIKTNYVWYPSRPKNEFENKMYITTKTVNPQYPVYII